MSQKRSASGEMGAKVKRLKKDKKSKKAGKSRKKASSRLFKIDKALYEALCNAQRDVTVDGTELGVGSISVDGEFKLAHHFFDNAGGEDKGLCKVYTVDAVKRPTRTTRAEVAPAKPASADAAGRSESTGGTEEDKKSKKKKKKEDALGSNEIPLKIFTKDTKDVRLLVEDVASEYKLKAPARARRITRTKKVVPKLKIVDSISKDQTRHKPKIIETKIATKVEEKERQDVGPNPFVIRGKILQLFQKQPAWSAKELSVQIGIPIANIKQHLHHFNAIYHPSGALIFVWMSVPCSFKCVDLQWTSISFLVATLGELNSKWTIEKRFSKV